MEFNKEIEGQNFYGVMYSDEKKNYYFHLESSNWACYYGINDDPEDLMKEVSIPLSLGTGFLSNYYPDELDKMDFLSDEWKENVVEMLYYVAIAIANNDKKQPQKHKKTPQPQPLFAVIVQSYDGNIFPQIGEPRWTFSNWGNPTGEAVKRAKDTRWGYDVDHYLRSEWEYWSQFEKKKNVILQESEVVECYGNIESCLMDLKDKGFNTLVYVSDKKIKITHVEGFDLTISIDDLWKKWKEEKTHYVYLGMECVLELLIK